MARILNEFDTFKLLMQEHVDSVDNQVIFMLYQPIIGVNATALYLTLVQEKQLTNRTNLDFNHTRLMLLLNINKTDLLNAFKKLELYKLIVSYYYTSKSTYIYDLKRPLSAEIFFENENLRSKLLEKLGTLQYERQKYYFLTSEPELTDDFINVSSTNELQDTEISVNGPLKTIINNLNKIELPLNELPLNNFNPSLTSNKYQPQANLEKETTININQNKTLFNATLAQMQVENPEVYLLSLTKKAINFKMKTTLQLLINEYKLTNGVINCLLEYVWFKNDKRIEPNYILKIAKTFQENNINSVVGALKHLKLAYSKSKKHSYNQTYQQNVLWTKDNFNFEAFNENTIKKNKTKKIKNGTMTPEEIKKILEEFDNY